MAVSKRTRFECFKRDAFTCQYCGQKPPTVILHADHIVPASKGGVGALWNLVTACEGCNLGKSNIELDKRAPDTVKEAMARERERRLQAHEYNQFLAEIREQDEAAIHGLGLHWYNQCRDGKKNAYIFGPPRVASIKTFLKRLVAEEVLDAINVAFARYPAFIGNDNRTWKYFCGVVWTKIKCQEGGSDAR